MKTQKINNKVKKLKTLILEELEKCNDIGVYPKLCRMKHEKNGIDLILNHAYNIVINTGESVQTALSKIESDY